MSRRLTGSYGAQVKEYLRDAIIAGELRPGDRINEVRLSEELGISRTPLREAVSALATEGWIEQTPHRGSKVAAFDPSSIAELLSVRWILETGALKLILQRQDLDQAADQLVEAGDRSGEVLTSRSFSLDPSSDFHLCLLRESQNVTLYDFGSSVHAKLRAVRFRSGVDQPRREAALAEHDQIIAAIRAGDHKLAESTLQQHLSRAAARITSP